MVSEMLKGDEDSFVFLELVSPGVSGFNLRPRKQVAIARRVELVAPLQPVFKVTTQHEVVE